MNAKYVILANEYNGGEEAVIIPAWGYHIDACKNLVNSKPIAGGEFQLGVITETGQIRVRCFGKSQTLGISSRGEKDAEKIEQLLRIGTFSEA